ncbi:hypothetical protein GTW25_02275 [Aliihoeflea aestuarii]|jgi:hypothetical protein|uniref:hypothetical protein n=1 Tax=Aliihoeflea aestuarii TaxID=453840 RepID=UPI00209223ED|nr:hypothetical protein [Aliihoeflea aestuarii]MCO6389854.1 hypothetical protein [Aliihoeflea aestuarii]
MTKLELAVKDAAKLPAAVQEKLGEDLLHAVHRILALQDELAIGVEQLDRGEGLPLAEVMADLKRRYGA